MLICYLLTFAPPSVIYHRTCFWKILSIWLVKLYVCYLKLSYYSFLCKCLNIYWSKALIIDIYNISSDRHFLKKWTCKSHMLTNQIRLTNIKCSRKIGFYVNNKYMYNFLRNYIEWNGMQIEMAYSVQLRLPIDLIC